MYKFVKERRVFLSWVYQINATLFHWSIFESQWHERWQGLKSVCDPMPSLNCNPGHHQWVSHNEPNTGGDQNEIGAKNVRFDCLSHQYRNTMWRLISTPNLKHLFRIPQIKLSFKDDPITRLGWIIFTELCFSQYYQWLIYNPDMSSNKTTGRQSGKEITPDFKAMLLPRIKIFEICRQDALMYLEGEFSYWISCTEHSSDTGK